MSGSGGAAAVAGVDFQQRIAALVMLYVLSGVKNLAALQLGEGVDITEISFETEDAVDDIVLTTSKGRVFIQAKRTISLSLDHGSDFASVICQFTKQQISDSTEGDVFLLITSSRSSRKITTELRRITDAARLHELASKTTPFTASESDTLAKTRQLASHFHRITTDQEISTEEFWGLLRKIRVALVDIEAGSPLEAAAMTLLSSCSDLKPSLVWGALIALAISLAKDRHTIDKAALQNRMGLMFRSAESVKEPSLMPAAFAEDGYLSAGRDVIFAKSFLDAADYLVFELHRFNPDGTRRVRYHDNRVQLTSGAAPEVLRRTATMVGMERYLVGQKELLNGSRVAIIKMDDSGEVEEQPFVLAYRARCQALLRANMPSLKCVRCGDPVSESLTPSVEIDEDEKNILVGLCHEGCVHPTDRIIGEIRSDFFSGNPLLKNFDYKKWFVLLPNGQCGLRQATQLPGVKPMLWNPSFRYSQAGQWCVRMDLSDGSARYAYERGRVSRLGQEEAERQATTFNESFAAAKVEGNPWCYTSVTDVYTTYNQALALYGAAESYLECQKATAVRYSTSIGSAYSKIENYYAPLVMLVEKESGDPVLLKGVIYLLTDPLSLSKHMENWRSAGVEIPEFVVTIIETDAEFDTLVRQMEEREIVIIVDPMFSKAGGLLSGVIVENINKVIRGSMEKDALDSEEI